MTAHISTREKEVLHWVAEGKTDAETSIILGISCHTIQHHKRVLMRKLDVYKDTALVAQALRQGIIQ